MEEDLAEYVSIKEYWKGRYERIKRRESVAVVDRGSQTEVRVREGCCQTEVKAREVSCQTEEEAVGQPSVEAMEMEVDEGDCSPIGGIGFWPWRGWLGSCWGRSPPLRGRLPLLGEGLLWWLEVSGGLPPPPREVFPTLSVSLSGGSGRRKRRKVRGDGESAPTTHQKDAEGCVPPAPVAVHHPPVVWGHPAMGSGGRKERAPSPPALGVEGRGMLQRDAPRRQRVRFAGLDARYRMGGLTCGMARRDREAREGRPGRRRGRPPARSGPRGGS